MVRFSFKLETAEKVQKKSGMDQVKDLWISQEIWHFSTFSVLDGTLFLGSRIPQRARLDPGPLEFFEGG